MIFVIIGLIVCGGILFATGIPQALFNSVFGNGQSE